MATINGSNGNDSLVGTASDDTITGFGGNDTLRGNDGADVLDGGSGSNSISGGSGNDEIIGGSGADTFSGGSGQDTINYADSDSAVFVDLSTNSFSGGDADNDVNAGGIDAVVGSDYDDVLTGYDGSSTNPSDAYTNEFWGGAGNDTLDGRGGGDYLDGGADDDVIDGGSGNDTIAGGTGNDSIDGGSGNDTITGGTGNDTIDGGSGNDTIDGGDGNDSIIAGTGSDSVFGGDGQDTILGGGDNDTLSGGADDDYIKIVSIGTNSTNTTVLGGSDGNDNDTLDLSYLISQGFEITHMVQNPENNGNAGFNGQIQLYNASTGQSININFQDIETFVPCFTPGTRIATARGECLVEELRVGDRVVTRDNGLQEIRWVGRRDLADAELTLTPHLRPVLIRAGSLGKNLPERDMMVSPNHRMLLCEDRSVLYFDEYEVLAAAKHLTHRQGIETVPRGGVSYVHFMFDQHEIVLADNTWSESFQPGDQSLGSMASAQRDEIFEIFPELAHQDGLAGYTAARLTLKRHEARLLA